MSGKALVERHKGDRMFRLRPDLELKRGNLRLIADTKWKLIDQADKSKNYKISQTDIYQLYGYLKKYLPDQNFKEDVLIAIKPVLVDFGAKWCRPCKKLSPIIDEIAEEMKDKIYVFKIDVDENPETSKKYKVESLPSLMIFKNGKLISTKNGLISKNKLTDWIKELY